MGVKATLSSEPESASAFSKKQAAEKRQMPLKRDEWPRIRDTRKEGSKSRYVVDLRPHVYGAGSRLYFDNLEAAKLRAKELATEHRNKGVEVIDFPTELRIEAADCIALLRPYGVSLRKAVEHHVKWLKEEQHRTGSRRVSDCIDDYLAAREMQLKTGELSPITFREIRTRMKQLKAA